MTPDLFMVKVSNHSLDNVYPLMNKEPAVNWQILECNLGHKLIGWWGRPELLMGEKNSIRKMHS